MSCEVCGNPEVVGVASCGFGPISTAFCADCAEKRLAPYGIMVAYVSCAGEYPDDINDAYVAEVQRILKELGKTEEEFAADVHQANVQMYEDMERMEKENPILMRDGYPTTPVHFEDMELEGVIDVICYRYQDAGVDKIVKLAKKVAEVGYGERLDVIINAVPIDDWGEEVFFIVSFAYVDVLDELFHFVKVVHKC